MRRIVSIIIIVSMILSVFGLMTFLDLTTEDVSAATEISGPITMDQLWTTSDSPIYIVDNVTLTNGANITVNPDVKVFYNGSFSITIDNGNFIARGTKSKPVIFDSIIGLSPALIEVHQSGQVELDWCEFSNASIAVKLINNDFKTEISNSTFNDSCSKYFELTNSKLNVTSSKFDGKQFDAPSVLFNNLNNKLALQDESSELYIQYFVNVNTVNGSLEPIPDINVDINDQYKNWVGKTDIFGRYWYFSANAVRINGTTPEPYFIYQTTASVSDKWDGTSQEVPGISSNQTIITNVSSAAKDNDLYIPISFMFKYPPEIRTVVTNYVVYEDTKYNFEFKIQDNDDLTVNYNNLTINITDKKGRGIYGTNGKDKWIAWDDVTQELIIYRTIESPFTPPGPNNHSAIVGENIYITVIDQDGQKDSLGPIEIEYHNVPDKPVISGIPQPWVVWVTEDVETNIPIKVSDNDNATIDIDVTPGSKYVSYEYNPLEPTTQNLRLFYPNEFGVDGEIELVFVNATDGCSEPVIHSFLVEFNQTPDPPKIIGKIPNKVGFEDTWEPDLSLGEYAADPDPDDDWTTLKWYVTGLDTKVYGRQLFTVYNENATANTPLSFSLNPTIDLGGSRNPQTVEEKVTLWLMDKDGYKTSQDISVIIKSTNQPPSMHKVDYDAKKMSVVPDLGDTADTYKFMVEYRDLDGQFGDAPEYVIVYIDGVPYDMTAEDPEDTDYRDGNIYIFETSNLTAGVHEHYFECSDSSLVTRFPLSDAEPNNFSLPQVEAGVFITKKASLDGNFIVRLAHTTPEPFVNVVDAQKPNAELEPGKDEKNKTKGDIGVYFEVNTRHLESILWAEFTVKFGSDYNNYDTTWLRKTDMQLAYYSPEANEWNQLLFSQMNTNTKILNCNLTPETGQDTVLESMLSSFDKPIFTVVGTLDADGDGYFNSRDAFPFDPAAREDRDSDGSPGKNEWCPGKSEKDSTTGLHEDKFLDDPAASIDNDNDGCPDEWNPGKSREDSTSKPKLDLDAFIDEPGACLDTDGDGMPDTINFQVVIEPTLIEDTDDDNDGMPDWWEEEQRQYAIDNNLTNKFDPKNLSDADEDWDGDGRSNLDEYRKNSDPYKKDVVSKDDNNLLNILPIVIVIVIILIIIGLFMYTKMRRDTLLENKIRAKILDLISKNPGIHYRKILNELNLNMSVLTHHLNMLEQQQFIKSLQDSMYRRFYAINAPINKELILSNVQLKILTSIHDTPGISQSEIARNLGVARKVVNYHIRILSDANFINVEPSGRESQCYYLEGLDYKTVHT